MLPSQICNQLPNILNQQLNSRLTAIPQSISLTQILNAASGAFGLDKLLAGGDQCSAGCSGVAAAPQQQQKLPTLVSPPISSQPG
jgi:hypothetical protein